MPKVRASSGMIGTTRWPTAVSRNSARSSTANAIVVETDRGPDPAKKSAKQEGSGRPMGADTTTRRGTAPPSCRRRSSRYSRSAEPGCGRQYGGSPLSSTSSEISSVRPRRSRSALSWGVAIFLIWWVELRPSISGPSAHPFTVFTRITDGAPWCSVAFRYAA